MEMEMPECPVCLQSYNEEDDIIPRVLSCGHTACESCVLKLPRFFHNTNTNTDAFPCPACTQLVRFPNPSQGPSSLPKNIDLLRFFSSSSSQNSKKNKLPKAPTFPPTPENDFLPHPWTPDFYSAWKDWILPRNLISSTTITTTSTTTTATSTITVDMSNCPLHFKADQCVSLLPIACYSSTEKDSCFISLSYTARVMDTLYRMGDAERCELGFFARASLRQRGVCAVYGVWMDLDNGVLFLVCERVGGDLSKRVIDQFKDGFVGVVWKDDSEEQRNSRVKDAVYSFALLGMELCEAVMGLHSECIVIGCLAPSCIFLDDYGHLSIDLNDVLELGRRVRKIAADAGGSSRTSDSSINNVGFAEQLMKTQAFVSPEMFLLLRNGGVARKECSETLGSYQSDSWSLACIFIRFLIGEERFNAESLKDFYCLVLTNTKGNHDELLQLYNAWMEKVISSLDTLLILEFKILVQVLSQCLNYDPGSRPHVSDLWRCIRGLLIKPGFDLKGLDISVMAGSSLHCLILGDLSLPRRGENGSQMQNSDDWQKCDGILGNISGLGLCGSSGDVGSVMRVEVDRGIVEGLQAGNFKSVTLQGHRDCITGLTVGGGFLFSSSFDKTVHVWSLQDFSHVQSLRGHEHRVTAVIAMDADNLLCVSGDSGGGIFVWSIGVSPGKELLKKWNEHNDWRYSGVHSLAVSGTDYLYSGSGDKSIKAWSMQVMS
eukprot:TRINITY_DN9000_c0_g2_i2.p1 TRINITY_DN9000_c0_g2~~TRINITY_DN9000_c0_g2_i2.p1  ORF type:complete len:716 (-),score=116.97 TRINITY_DN9000_c0_g2_i2:498-2645(-)